MTDLVGTVRREEHEGGYSLFALVEKAVVEIGRPFPYKTSVWLCIHSTASGNCGETISFEQAERHPVIGYIPGTPAFDEDMRQVWNQDDTEEEAPVPLDYGEEFRAGKYPNVVLGEN